MPKRRGLYERLISERFAEELRALAMDLIPQRDSLRAAEAGDRLALHLARLVERSVDDLSETDRVEKGARARSGAHRDPGPGARRLRSAQ
jgi:hypothetical protein